MQYEVLKDFKGSPDGRYAVQYKAGETVELTESLAKVALEEKWVKPCKGSKKQKENSDDKAEAERLAAESQRKIERDAAIQLLRNEITQLEDEGITALATDPSGETAKPIQAKWEEKQNELEALLLQE